MINIPLYFGNKYSRGVFSGKKNHYLESRSKEGKFCLTMS